MIQIINKPWGYEKILVNNNLYCGKILHIDKDKGFSWQYHKTKDETFYILSGKCLLFFSNENNIMHAFTKKLLPEEVFRIFPFTRHKIIALEDTEIIEISTQHFNEDTYRLKE